MDQQARRQAGSRGVMAPLHEHTRILLVPYFPMHPPPPCHALLYLQQRTGRNRSDGVSGYRRLCMGGHDRRPVWYEPRQRASEHRGGEGGFVCGSPCVDAQHGGATCRAVTQLQCRPLPGAATLLSLPCKTFSPSPLSPSPTDAHPPPTHPHPFRRLESAQGAFWGVVGASLLGGLAIIAGLIAW